MLLALPEGHSAMDKALPCHADGRGSNPDTIKDFSAPILLEIPAMCTLSFAMPVVMCSSVTLGEVKREESCYNPCNVWEEGD